MALEPPEQKAQVAAPSEPEGPAKHPVIARMRHLGLEDTDRCKVLDAYQSFCEGTHHDHLQIGWDGNPRTASLPYMFERLASMGAKGWTTAAAQDIAAAAKRPDAAAPIAAQIVGRFTEMLLGAHRRPSLLVNSDDKTQAFLDAVFSAGGVWESLTAARDCAGSCGAAVIVCGVRGGKPYTETLNPKHCWVPTDSWAEDGAGRWRPRVLIEQYLAATEYLCPETGKLKTGEAWVTRAWDDRAVYEWPPVPTESARDKDFVWPSPVEHMHPLSVCPAVWVQNTRNDKTPEGDPDCKGVWQLIDKVDRLWSQVCKATYANVDPSVVVKEKDRARRRGLVLRRGGAMGVSEDGDISYLEMQGTGVQTALKVIDELEHKIYQTTECVVIRPENAKVYQSGEALQILWRSMESRANRLRSTMETAIRDICEIWIMWAEKVGVGNLDKPSSGGGLMLPPRRVDAPQYTVRDELGKPTGKLSDKPSSDTEQPTSTETTWETHEVGEGRYVSMKWPPYWNPTAVQMQTVLTALTAAAGTEPVLSQEACIRHAANYVGSDGDEELARMERERAAKQARAEAMISFEPEPEPGGGGAAPDPEGSRGESGGVPGAKSKTRGMNPAPKVDPKNKISNDKGLERSQKQ